MDIDNLTPAQAFDLIGHIGRKHALILQGYGGVLTIVHPNAQKEEGVYERIQYNHGLGDHPKKLDGTYPRASVNYR